jgi:hypothetical protein
VYNKDGKAVRDESGEIMYRMNGTVIRKKTVRKKTKRSKAKVVPKDSGAAKVKTKVVRKKIDWETALNCVKAQCTIKETAAILDVCENTLRERCLEENGVSLLEFVKIARIAGLASLRRRLFQMGLAKKDNFPALKFALGNYLKMYEKNELVVAAKYTQYTDEERKILRQLAIEKAQKELNGCVEQAVVVHG